MSGTTAVLLINSLGIGGAERATSAAAVQLRHLGHDVRMICLERAPEDFRFPIGFEVEHLSSMRASSSSILKLFALPLLGVRLARYLARFHVPVVMSHLFRANFVNVLARVLAGSPHRAILVNHTRLSRLFAEGIQGRITWRLCRLLYPRADLLASVSIGAARESEQLLGLPDGKSITLYDPIDISTCSTAPKDGSRAHSIVAMGRMVPLKRFQDLIQAFSLIAPDYPDAELLLIGDGPERNKLEGLAAAAGISNRVRFLGMLEKPTAAFAGCGVFIFASETEGFGMAIVEALAAGIPVIASDCPYGPREILSPATDPMNLLKQGSAIELAPFGVLYPVGSVKALENALRRVLSDQSLRSVLSRNGPARAADFSVERSTAAYEKLLFA